MTPSRRQPPDCSRSDAPLISICLRRQAHRAQFVSPRDVQRPWSLTGDTQDRTTSRSGSISVSSPSMLTRTNTEAPSASTLTRTPKFDGPAFLQGTCRRRSTPHSGRAVDCRTNHRRTAFESADPDCPHTFDVEAETPFPTAAGLTAPVIVHTVDAASGRPRYPRPAAPAECAVRSSRPSTPPGRNSVPATSPGIGAQ